MAEGWAKELKSDKIEAYSAGIEKHGQNPNAIEVMREAGIDISNQQSNTVDELPIQNFDVVVTVCAHADENCPVVLSQGKVIHVGFDDPPKLAKNPANREEELDAYRQVRDQIRDFILTIPESIQ